MRTKVAFIFLAAAIAFAFSFFVRERTLNELRAANDYLRQPSEAQTPIPASELENAIQPTNAVPALSREERLELLRLRGQILPLRSELAEASNRVAMARQPGPQRAPPPAPQVPASVEARAQEMQAFRQSEAFREANSFAVALGKYLAQNSGQIPDDLAKVEPYGGSALAHGVSQRFELVLSGAVPEDASSFTLVAREKDPQQRSDGTWRHVFLFADGSTVILSTLNPNVQAPDWPAMQRRAESQAKQRAQQRENASAH